MSAVYIEKENHSEKCGQSPIVKKIKEPPLVKAMNEELAMPPRAPIDSMESIKLKIEKEYEI